MAFHRYQTSNDVVLMPGSQSRLAISHKSSISHRKVIKICIAWIKSWKTPVMENVCTYIEKMNHFNLSVFLSSVSLTYTYTIAIAK